MVSCAIQRSYWFEFRGKQYSSSITSTYSVNNILWVWRTRVSQGGQINDYRVHKERLGLFAYRSVYFAVNTTTKLNSGGNQHFFAVVELQRTPKTNQMERCTAERDTALVYSERMKTTTHREHEQQLRVCTCVLTCPPQQACTLAATA